MFILENSMMLFPMTPIDKGTFVFSFFSNAYKDSRNAYFFYNFIQKSLITRNEKAAK